MSPCVSTQGQLHQNRRTTSLTTRVPQLSLHIIHYSLALRCIHPLEKEVKQTAFTHNIHAALYQEE